MRASSCVGVVVAGLLAVPCAALAQSGADRSGVESSSSRTTVSAEQEQTLRQEIDQLKRDFDARLAALEAKLASAQSSATPVPSPAGAVAGQPTAPIPDGAQGAGGQSGTLPVYGAATAGSKIFNPDIAVIGDFVGTTGNNEVRPDPVLQMQESEASFQAVVDPFASRRLLHGVR